MLTLLIDSFEIPSARASERFLPFQAQANIFRIKKSVQVFVLNPLLHGINRFLLNNSSVAQLDGTDLNCFCSESLEKANRFMNKNDCLKISVNF